MRALARSTEASSRATRRAANWPGGAPQGGSQRREVVRPALGKREHPNFKTGRDEEKRRIALQARLAQTTWTVEEREVRRVHAIQKQEELLTLLGYVETETSMRIAVADGELPVLPLELAALEV